MSTSKSVFESDHHVRLSYADEDPTPLMALHVLPHVEVEHLFNEARRGRSPASTYINSISRICDRTIGLCQSIERRFTTTLDYPEDGIPSGADYYVEAIELALYAAAEHVDDIDRIARGFFQNNKACEKHAAFKALDAAVKKSKKPLAMMANRVKHEALRVRSVATEFCFDEHCMWLHGFRLETVKDGLALPDGVAHGTAESISTVTLAWEIVIFLLQCSDALYAYIKSILGLGEVQPAPYPKFAQLVRSILRLPQYDFGTEGPLKRYPVSVADHHATIAEHSALLGSFPAGWGFYVKARPARISLETVAEKGMGIQLNMRPHGEFYDWLNQTVRST